MNETPPADSSPVKNMLVLRNIDCKHVVFASATRTPVTDFQARIVTLLGRRDFRIQTVTADEAAAALLDLDRGVCCDGCTLDPRPEGTT